MADSRQESQHDYESAGYNGFFRRSIGSDANATNLRSLVKGNNRSLKFDDQQVSGAVGDTFKVGPIHLKGKSGNIDIVDEQGNVLVRLGRVDD